jgi:septum formation protein
MKRPKFPLILASNSPRRSALLSQINLKFIALPARIKEQILLNEKPEDYVERIALAKGNRIAKKYPNSTVIGADTIVVLENKILGKPKTKIKAKEMLRELQGKKHKVITGISVINKSKNIELSQAIKTDVKMKALSEKEIDGYVRTKEPLDKAGAYAIQGIGAVLIDEIKGSYTNVVGLPLDALCELLRKAEIEIWEKR